MILGQIIHEVFQLLNFLVGQLYFDAAEPSSEVGPPLGEHWQLLLGAAQVRLDDDVHLLEDGVLSIDISRHVVVIQVVLEVVDRRDVEHLQAVNDERVDITLLEALSEQLLRLFQLGLVDGLSLVAEDLAVKLVADLLIDPVLWVEEVAKSVRFT